jgi:lysophospholipase L1-like esterase
VAGEAALRVYAHHLRDPAERWDAAAGTFALVPGRHVGAAGTVVVNEAGFVGDAPARAEGQPAPGLTIVALGDSCTFGAGDGVHGYPALLARRLATRAGGAERVEVVNAGISGLDTRQVMRRLDSRVAPLRPDVALVYVGWNDLTRKSPLAQGDLGWRGDLVAALDRLWAVRAARKAVFQILRPRLATPRTGPESRSGRFRYYVPVRYAEDLRRLVARVRAIGAEPVLLTLPTPLRPDATEAQIRRARITFPSVWGTYAVGDFLDLLAAHNLVIRQVAREADAPLVDLAGALGARPDAFRYFHDTMHPNDRGMEAIAVLLETSLTRLGWTGRDVDARRAGDGADHRTGPGETKPCAASRAC